jgi:hypothetical protein
LAGDEIRPCWEAWPGTVGATNADPVTIGPANPTARVERRIEFVEVGERSADEAPAASGEPVVPPGPIPPATEPGWSLWGDPDR